MALYDIKNETNIANICAKIKLFTITFVKKIFKV